MRRIMNAFSVALLLFFGAYMYAQEPSDNRKLQQEEQKPSKAEREKPSKAEQEKPSKQESAKPTQEGRDRRAAAAAASTGRVGKGVHIPDDKFRAHFGRQHTFVVNRPVIVEGQPRFQFAGYWFEIVDPWPVGWAYTDSCYIDFIDGEYFLFDALHPGVQIAVFVVE